MKVGPKHFERLTLVRLLTYSCKITSSHSLALKRDKNWDRNLFTLHTHGFQNWHVQAKLKNWMALLVNNFDWKMYMCKRHLGACTKDNSQKWHLCHLQAKWNFTLTKLYWVVFKIPTEGSEISSFLECQLTENETGAQVWFTVWKI